MSDQIIVGIDSSTQSTKSIAWSVCGDLIAEGRADIPMSTPQKDFCEQDPQDWWDAACQSLQSLCSQIDASKIAGVAISNQRETIGFFDKDMRPVYPAILWLDGRSGEQVKKLDAAIGGEAIHQISGKPLDLTPSHSSILWVMENVPDVTGKLAHILDVSSYLALKLTGERKVSWASADPSGVFDIAQRSWSSQIVNAMGISADSFASPVSPGALIGVVGEVAAKETGLAVGTKLFAGAGDGQCAGIGANATRPGRVYLNLGTAIVTGIWSDNTNISRAWRTMMSPTDQGYFLEGVMRAGTYLVDWFKEQYVDGPMAGKSHAELQEQAGQIEIGSKGLVVCPYLSGCMTPHWDGDARAAFYGVSSIHSPIYLYRAAMEGLSGEIARTIFDMKSSGLEVNEIVAVGGGANSALWRKMVADSAGVPLTISKSLEASSLGAAMIAAVGAGIFTSFDEAADRMSQTAESYLPDMNAHSEWQPLLKRQSHFNAFCCHNAEMN